MLTHNYLKVQLAYNIIEFEKLKLVGGAYVINVWKPWLMKACFTPGDDLFGIIMKFFFTKSTLNQIFTISKFRMTQYYNMSHHQTEGEKPVATP